MTFKVGDLVECIDKDAIHGVGNRFNILEVSPDGLHIRIDGTGLWLKSRFKLIEPSEKSRGQLACEAFAARRRISGHDYSGWNHLDVSEQEAWEAAAIANREIPSQSITKEELDVVAALKSAYNAYQKLDQRDADQDEHFLQSMETSLRIITFRIAKRVNPEVWGD